MVSRKRKAVAAINTKSVSTQTLPAKKDAATQASGCAECLCLALAPENGMGGTCVRCDQVNDLLCLVAELKEEVERLRSIRESEEEIDWWGQTLLNPKGVQQEMAKPCPSCHKADRTDLIDGGEWKQVPDRRGKRTLSQTPSPPLVPLTNRYEALDPENQAEDRQEDPPGEPPGLTSPTKRITTAAVRRKKKRRVVVVGDSLLRGTEGPICRPDPSHREVCCLPGARVRDVNRRLPELIQPSDYYPLLVVQVGSEDVNRRGTKVIKKDFKALGQSVHGTGTQVIFASVPVLAGMDEELNKESSRKAHLINRWLKDWCHRQNFGFFDHGASSMVPTLLKSDGLHPSRESKRIIAHKLAGLIRRALN